MWSAATVLVCALSVLGRSERHFHPINLVDVAPPGASQNAEGFATRNPDTIHLLTSSAAFREAAKAQTYCGARPALAKVASILVHEEWHLKNGPDERGAYSQQLTTLAALGYDESSSLYWGVKKSMLSRLQRPPQIASLGDTRGPR